MFSGLSQIPPLNRIVAFFSKKFVGCVEIEHIWQLVALIHWVKTVSNKSIYVKNFAKSCDTMRNHFP